MLPPTLFLFCNRTLCSSARSRSLCGVKDDLELLTFLHFLGTEIAGVHHLASGLRMKSSTLCLQGLS